MGLTREEATPLLIREPYPRPFMAFSAAIRRDFVSARGRRFWPNEDEGPFEIINASRVCSAGRCLVVYTYTLCRSRGHCRECPYHVKAARAMLRCLEMRLMVRRDLSRVHTQ